MIDIKLRYPAIPTHEANMLARVYPRLDGLLSQARDVISDHPFAGIVLHATVMRTVVGYCFGIDGAEDGAWFSSGELVHLGNHRGFNFVEDSCGRRLLLASLAGEHGATCLSQKKRHIEANQDYFAGARLAAFGLLHTDDASTIRAALATAMLEAQPDTGELFSRLDPNKAVRHFGGMIVHINRKDLETIDGALHEYLSKGYGDADNRPVDIHLLATNTSEGADPELEVFSSFDDEGIKSLAYTIQVAQARLP